MKKFKIVLTGIAAIGIIIWGTQSLGAENEQVAKSSTINYSADGNTG
ncbi:hypothetical protein M3215_11930 [Bacillus cytotoxicus]|uniref:Uncharacterized protein n=1 Tax=Bacillus cytotoxicus TaxID=580165 RepID=A0ACC6A7F9_9BACI|nr:hypothetical protein [Bacillus cytotoxicus]